jgi:hypothetical protein
MMRQPTLEALAISDGKLALTLAMIHSLTSDLATCHKLGFWRDCPLEMLGHPLEDRRINPEWERITPKTICAELYSAELQHTLDLLAEGFRLIVSVAGLIARAKRMSAEMAYTPKADLTVQQRRAAKRSAYGKTYRNFHKERLAQNQRNRRNKNKTPQEA